MRGKYGIGFRLSVLLAVLVVIAGIAGMMGILGIASVNEALNTKIRNTAVMGEVRFLMNDNRAQVMLALQHNPANPLSKLHDHPVEMHLDQIVKNRDQITALWEGYRGQALADAERAAAEQYANARERYITEGLMVVIAAIRSGDYDKASADLLQKVNPLLKAATVASSDLTRLYSPEAAAQSATQADQVMGFWRNLVIVINVLGGLIALIFGNWIIRGIVRPLDAMTQHVESAVEANDFSGAVVVAGQCEVGRAAQGFNGLMGKLRQIIGNLRDSVGQLAQAAHELTGLAGNVHQASDQQSEAVESAAAAIEEISVSLSHTADNATQSRAIAESSRDAVDAAIQITHAAMTEMEGIAGAIRDSRSEVQELAQRSEAINGIVGVIKEIADQTNLLALNAAIEAARAGETGRGFAVVADEVRKLAERTSQSTQEIAGLVGATKEQVDRAVATMQVVDERSVRSVQLTRQSEESLRGVVKGAEDSVAHMRTIADALHEQDAAVREIAVSVERIARMTEGNSAAASQNRRVAEEMERLSGDLRSVTLQFRI